MGLVLTSMDLDPQDWRTVLDALESLQYDVDDDPEEYLPEAGQHIQTVIEKASARMISPRSVIYR